MHQIISTQGAPAAIGPYSQGIVVPPGKKIIFISGQLPIVPGEKKVIEAGITEQTKLALENSFAILHAAGGVLTDVVRVEVLLTDITEFGAMNEAYTSFFGEHKPARKAYQVAALPLGAKIEVVFTAAIE